MTSNSIRLGVDIGGTFTDVVLEKDGQTFSTKVLTTYAAPEDAIIDGMQQVCAKAGITPGQIDQIIHGTTLATNALIERRGAKTALITTEGFRDVIEMRTESRFEQYDLNLKLPDPLLPRHMRFTVPGRVDARGGVLVDLNRADVEAVVDKIAQAGFESVAVGLIHSYLNPTHEHLVREVLAEKLPDVSVSISSEVSPQMREYERFNTVVANAYIKPLDEELIPRPPGGVSLREQGIDCPIFLMHSGGGIISILRARPSFPVRLVESGPAGGAVFRGRHRCPLRAGQGAELRHGRHDGQDLPDQEPDAQDQPRVRGRAVLSLQEGLGHADLDPGDRHGGDRGGRRLSWRMWMRCARSGWARRAPGPSLAPPAMGGAASDPP